MYMYLLNLIAQHKYKMVNPKKQANYLVVSTMPNFYSKVVPITMSEIRHGFFELQKLLRYVAYLIHYKGYSFNDNIGKYQL